MPVQNAEIAAMFDQTADLLELQGDNPFRVRAYRRAALIVGGLPQSAGALLSEGRDLSELPAIGKDLAGKIADIVETGHFQLLESLKKKFPGQLGEMAALPGLGPKRIKLLYPDPPRAPVEAGQGRDHGVELANGQGSRQEQPLQGQRFVEATHDHQPVDDLAGTA